MAEFSDAKSGAYCMCTRERCSDECRTYRQFHPKPVTNADRIRAMTDEELAEFIVRCVEADFFRVNVLGTHSNSAGEWLDWMKEEVEEET